MNEEDLIPQDQESENEAKPQVIARMMANHVSALSLIMAKQDPRDYLNGINVKPHPALPGIILTATNGHHLLSIYDCNGYASREFIFEVSKQLLAACKIKARNNTHSEWVEVFGDTISVVQKELYIDDEILPEVKKPLPNMTNGIFNFSEIDGVYPPVFNVIPDIKTFTGFDGSFSVNCEYLNALQKAISIAAGVGRVNPTIFVKDAQSSAVVLSHCLPNIVGVVMPMREAIDISSFEYDEWVESFKAYGNVDDSWVLGNKSKADDEELGQESEPEQNKFFDETGKDVLQQEAVEFVKERRRASVSSVQRKFKIGYNRAARIIEQMEQDGVIREPNHLGVREVLA